MKTDVVSKLKRFVEVLALILIFGGYYVCGYLINNYMLYRDIQVYVSNTAAVEFGTKNYDIKKIVKEVEGEIVSVKNEIDTSVLGSQEIVLEVKNGNVVKTVPVVVSVVDSGLPMIALNSEVVNITEGDDYSLFSNISYVTDDVDGDLNYVEGYDPERRSYYNFYYEGDFRSVGSHDITVHAVDGFGNINDVHFTIEVEPRPEPVYYNLPPNIYGGDLVATAYSLLGAPYVAGGTGNGGFDCSGFVQYVYSCAGINISRSTWTQLYDGLPVSMDSMQPGDIIIWGVNGQPTHSALYVGNNQMIHATNPNEGVVLSDVYFWLYGSGTGIISVRRI